MADKAIFFAELKMALGDPVARLRDLYRTHNVAAFFDWAATFKNDVAQSTVSRIQNQIGNGQDERPKETLAFCKKLEELGCGKLVLGRKGNKSRMEWAYTLRSIGAVARGDAFELEPRYADNADDEPKRSESIRFEIPLLPGRKATIQLPEDIGKNEVQKVLDFIERHFLIS